MGSFFSRMNPTLRGFLIIGLIALVVVTLNLYTALASIAMLLRIAFFLAIAFFVYLVWRERRSDIAVWPTRARRLLRGRPADRRRLRLLLLARPARLRRARVPRRP